MNDAEFDRHKQRLITLRERWWKVLGVGWWSIEFKYVRTDFAVNGKPEPDTVAYTTCDWGYLHGVIRWNMPNVADLDDDELERAFVHEAMHILINEAREDGDDWEKHHERVATTLCQAFLWLRDEMAMDIPRPLVNGAAPTGTLAARSTD
jgi:hypothetical protein